MRNSAMKCFFAIVAVCICGAILSAEAFAQADGRQWVEILASAPAGFDTRLVSSTEESVVVNVKVPGFYAVTVRTPRGEATVVTLPKSHSTAHAGEPDVPAEGIAVAIGDKARMAVRVVEAKYMDFEGMEVAPSKGDFPRTVDPATVPYTYGECYGKDAFFPDGNVELREPYIVRDLRGQNLAVRPFAYNPVSKTLRVYYDLTVEMYKVDDGGSNTLERKGERKILPDFDDIYRRHFINYAAASPKYTQLAEGGDLLIICHDAFMTAMNPLVNWKKTRGVHTTMVGTSTTGTSTSAILNYITSQYNSNPNLAYVLLVGDVAQIPGYSYSGGGYSYSGKGDNNYGQVAGNDIYNDLFIGRLSASTAAQVTTQVQKIIGYERDLTTTATWCQKGLGVSKKENGSGHNGEDDYQHIENLRTDLLNYDYTTVYQDYAGATSQGYPSSSTSTISSHINSGVGIINYCNHGSETSWQSHYYSSSNVNSLTNDNMLPFIFSVACLNGKYDYSSDCFAEAWMRATNNSTGAATGAVGTLMSYISQPWIPPMWAQDEFVDILVESYTNNRKRTWGGAAVNALFAIFDHYGTSEDQAVGTYQAWILFGDPTMMLRTKTPQQMSVINVSTITPSSTECTISVTGGNGALFTVTNASHNIVGTATVSGGSATVALSGNQVVGDEYTLCLFGYNKVTYVGTAVVEQPWVGEGTAASPYLISTTEEMDRIATAVNNGSSDFAGKYFKVVADLAYNPAVLDKDGGMSNYSPVGCYINSGTHHEFRGNFDGDGHTISGIRVNKSGSSDASGYVGLFGKPGNGAVIRNVILVDAELTGWRYVGGIAGVCDNGVSLSDNFVESVSVSATSGSTQGFGTIAGSVDGGSMLRNRYHGCTVNGTAGATGVGAQNSDLAGGAESVHTITLGPDVIATATATLTFSGTSYYLPATSVTLGYNGSMEIPLGYTFGYSATMEGTDPAASVTVEESNGVFSLAMPAADITVAAALNVADWALLSDGTEADPYVIYNSGQLDLLATRVAAGNGYSGKHFRQALDIAYSHSDGWNNSASTENNYTAVGTGTSPFQGTYDGDGHTVGGIRLYVSDLGEWMQGLFGHIDGGTVKGVTLADSRITGPSRVGGIVGSNDGGTVIDCHVASNVAIHTINPNASLHGGIAGYNNGIDATLRFCSSSARLTVADGLGTIDGTDYGAIAGANYRGTVSHNLAFEAAIPAVAPNTFGATLGSNSGSGSFVEYNYHYNCTVGGVANLTEVPTVDAEGGSWHAISTPVHPVGGTGVFATSALEAGAGYIHHSAADSLIQFVGIANAGSFTTPVSGFSLVGNPYPYAIDAASIAAAGGAMLAFGHYTLDSKGLWLANIGGEIAVGQAVMVQAITDGTVTFSEDGDKSAYEEGTATHLAFTLADGQYEDVAYAVFGNGNGLRKASHPNTEAPALSIRAGEEDYAIAMLPEIISSFPLSINATAGDYTLSFDNTASTHSFDYLHLIDNTTGSDIDLLVQSSYTFAATGSDADRFTVRLRPESEESSDHFVRWDGSDWIVDATQASLPATLEAFDIMGRRLFYIEIQSIGVRIPNSAFPGIGLYTLRLDEKSQKILVRQ